MPHKLEDLSVNLHTNSGGICVDVLEVEVRGSKQDRTILENRLQNCCFHDIGRQKAKVIRAKETDKGVTLIIPVEHWATALGKLDIVQHSKDRADGIRVDRRQGGEVEDTLNPHETHSLIATIPNGSVDDGQQHLGIGSSGRRVDTITIRRVERQNG